MTKDELTTMVAGVSELYNTGVIDESELFSLIRRIRARYDAINAAIAAGAALTCFETYMNEDESEFMGDPVNALAYKEQISLAQAREIIESGEES